MRRSQTLRHNPRPSQALNTDDLGVLVESDESTDDVLRKQLLEKELENAKLRMTIQTLQDLLAQRPPLQKVQDLEKEYKNLELILQGTQRENVRCMSDLERAKAREKMLERELARLAGENWQSSLDIPSSQTPPPVKVSASAPSLVRSAPVSSPATDDASGDRGATRAHIEQVRMLILGMDQRLEAREQKLQQTIQKAEKDAERLEGLRKEISAV